MIATNGKPCSQIPSQARPQCDNMLRTAPFCTPMNPSPENLEFRKQLHSTGWYELLYSTTQTSDFTLRRPVSYARQRKESQTVNCHISEVHGMGIEYITCNYKQDFHRRCGRKPILLRLTIDATVDYSDVSLNRHFWPIISPSFYPTLL
jgi:hypothetical protein